MLQASFRFNDELNDFLTAKQGAEPFLYSFEGRPAVKDAIEAIGIPHTEVAVITVNSQAVDFMHGLEDGDDLTVYPHSAYPLVDERFIQPFLPKGNPRFVLDVHLGKLAGFMRTAGFDTLHSSEDLGDERLAEIADTQGRVLLTRDVGLLKRSRIRFGYWLRQTQSREQFREVIRHYHLACKMRPFSRCTHCNGVVESVDKAAVVEQLPKGIADDPTLVKFVKCTDCGHVYWQGSHYTRMQQFFTSVIDEA